MLTILIITYICGMFVTGFILSMLSMFSNLSRAAYNTTTIICMILWPIIWAVVMVTTTLVMVGFIMYSGWKYIGRLIRMRSK
tara:strand:+ start:87938 stop:88183 length:246 start_codon:yes stop_codon:yes gene_type:complete